MIRQKAVIQTCEFDPYTICVEIYFERKYTVYKFDNTMGWIHMMIRQIRQSSQDGANSSRQLNGNYMLLSQ